MVTRYPLTNLLQILLQFMVNIKVIFKNIVLQTKIVKESYRQEWVKSGKGNQVALGKNELTRVTGNFLTCLWIIFPAILQMWKYFSGHQGQPGGVASRQAEAAMLSLLQRAQINPLMLRAAKRGLMILNIFYIQKHFLENIWRRSVYQKPNNNSPSNYFWTFALFKSYFQKYERSRRYSLEKVWVLMS